MCHICKKLEELLSPKRIASIVSDPNRNIENKGGISYLKDVRPICGVDPDTGDLFQLGTWEQPQTFNDVATFNSDIYLAATKRLFLDGGVDTFITESGSDKIDFYVGGLTKLRMSIRYGYTRHQQPVQYLDDISIKEQADPSATASYGKLWCRDNAGQTELWFVDDLGVQTQIV